MKFHKPWLPTCVLGSLLFAGATMAQDAAPPATPQSGTSESADTTGHSVSMNTSQGEVTVQSAMPAPPTFGPPPEFSQLASNGKSIDETQAAAYPPLANDFLHADRNRDGRISKREYERWTSHQ